MVINGRAALGSGKRIKCPENAGFMEKTKIGTKATNPSGAASFPAGRQNPNDQTDSPLDLAWFLGIF
jgi:hypothetical protein